MDFAIDDSGYIYVHNRYGGSDDPFAKENTNYFKIHPDGNAVVWAWRTAITSED